MNILHVGDKLPVQQGFFSQIARVIYCPPQTFWAGCIIFVISIFVIMFSLI